MNNYHKKTTSLLSVIVPCRNEEKSIGKCLECMIAQDYDKDKFEVLVIDGMSEDGTREIVKGYIKQQPFIRLLDNTRKNTPCAYNLGIKQAKGSFIAIVGAHNYISNNYLSTSVKYLQSNEADAVGSCGICIPVDSKFMSKTISLAMKSKFGVGSSFRTNRPKKVISADTVASPIYKREVFNEIGLFDEDLIRGQDTEFNARLIKNGGKILLAPDIISYYYTRGSLRALWRMELQYGYFKPLVVKKVGKVFTLRQLVPPLFVSVLAVSLTFSIFSHYFLWLFICIGFVYGVVSLLFSLKIARQVSLKCCCVLPLVFAIVHFGWASGYLKGIWDFIILKKDERMKIQDMPLTR